MENIYKPPAAELRKEGLVRESGPLWKAVLIGALIDIFGTLVLGVILGIAGGVVLTALNMPEHLAGTPFLWLGGLLGGMASAVGGYCCARIAHSEGYRAPLWLTLCMVAVGLIFYSQKSSLLMHAAFSLLTVVSVMLGAWLYNRRHFRVNSAA